MNANRRIEEFILKLSVRHNEPGLFDKINEIKLNIFLNNIKNDKAIFDNKTNSSFPYSIHK